jgi:Domain of Unknown Function (DUF1080)
MRISSIASHLCLILPLAVSPAFSQQWHDLFNGKSLDGWQVRGEGIWTVMNDGMLLGQRRHDKPSSPFADPWPITSKQYQSWLNPQAWLYTVRNDFGEFDLHVEYFIPPQGNSGVSIRDVSRGYYVIRGANDPVAPPTTLKGSPAHIGYEIQIIDGDSATYPTGSVYLFAAGKTGLQKRADWNSLDIESRNERIRVKVNGELAAESPGDPERSKIGPIGLQLHDQFSFVMFRNIRIREIKR